MATAYGNVLAELSAATDLKTLVTGTLVGTVMKLTKTLVVVNRATVLADLTAAEADFGGYAAEAVVWSANTLDDQGRAELLGVVGEFRPTDSVTPNQCYNGWLENGAGELLLCWQIANGPVPMESVFDSYQSTPRLRPGISGDVIEVT